MTPIANTSIRLLRYNLWIAHVYSLPPTPENFENKFYSCRILGECCIESIALERPFAFKESFIFSRLDCQFWFFEPQGLSYRDHLLSWTVHFGSLYSLTSSLQRPISHIELDQTEGRPLWVLKVDWFETWPPILERQVYLRLAVHFDQRIVFHGISDQKETYGHYWTATLRHLSIYWPIYG